MRTVNSEGAITFSTNYGVNFVPGSTPAVGSGPLSVTTADVNGDGNADLICANYYANTLTVLTNNGSGGFVPASTPGVGSGPYSVAAADVNGDGKVDLISANYNYSTLTVLFNMPNFTGSFTGDGSGLTSLNTGNLTGTIADAHLSTNVALLIVGTLPDANLTTNLARLNTNQTFTGTNTFAEAVQINGDKTLEFGAGVTKETNAGKIGYQTFTAETLDIVGAGTNGNVRKIKFFAEGGATFNGNVTIGAFPIIAAITNSPANTSTLTPTTGFVKLAPFSPVTLNTPTAIASATTPGTLLILQGTSDVNTVTIKDSANTQFGGGSDRVLGANDTLTLIWNGSVWVELSFDNN